MNYIYKVNKAMFLEKYTEHKGGQVVVAVSRFPLWRISILSRYT